MLGSVEEITSLILGSGPWRNDAVKQGLRLPFHARVLHEFDIGREDKDSLVTDRPRVGFRIVEHPVELDVAHVRPLEVIVRFALSLIGWPMVPSLA